MPTEVLTAPPPRQAAPPSNAWHALPAREVYDRLDVPATGLTAEEAGARLSRHGPNELPRPAHA